MFSHTPHGLNLPPPHTHTHNDRLLYKATKFLAAQSETSVTLLLYFLLCNYLNSILNRKQLPVIPKDYYILCYLTGHLQSLQLKVQQFVHKILQSVQKEKPKLWLRRIHSWMGYHAVRYHWLITAEYLDKCSRNRSRRASFSRYSTSHKVHVQWAVQATMISSVKLHCRNIKNQNPNRSDYKLTIHVALLSSTRCNY
jgi:hypothetical protein